MIDFALQKTLHTADGNMRLNAKARIESGQLVALYGESGSGKTSILRMLAGLMDPDQGWIKVNDTIWFDASEKVNIRPQRRSIGFVFQDYSLFPNMNVRENISFALSEQRPADIVEELLEITGLGNLSARKIQTLSGGQQQRVALARAIARKPDILLLDEPLSAIDDEMRVKLQDTLADVHKRYGLTSILVSHSAEEIIKLADTVFYLRQGEFQPPVKPANFFKMSAGRSSISGTILSIDNERVTVQLDDDVHKPAHPDLALAVNDRVEMARMKKAGPPTK